MALRSDPRRVQIGVFVQRVINDRRGPTVQRRCCTRKKFQKDANRLVSLTFTHPPVVDLKRSEKQDEDWPRQVFMCVTALFSGLFYLIRFDKEEEKEQKRETMSEGSAVLWTRQSAA